MRYDMFKINNSYETDPSTGSSSLSNNDLTKTLDTEWDFQNGSSLKDYLFPTELNETEHTFGKAFVNQHYNYNSHHRQTDNIDRSMVNSSQESDFYGFTPSSVINVENNNVPLEKLPENADIVDDDDNVDESDLEYDIETTHEHSVRYQNNLVLTQNDNHDTVETTITILEQRHGLEHTIASDEFSDQDIRCQQDMEKNEQQLQARIDNATAAVDECNESHLSIEPTSSDEENDKNTDEDIPTTTTATNTSLNFHTLCTLDENSNNAVDNAISNGLCSTSTPTDLSFNGKLTKLRLSTGSMLVPNNSNMGKDLTPSKNNTDTNAISVTDKSNLQWQLQLETSREHINERSPDLFSEADELDTAVNDIVTDTGNPHEDDDAAAASADLGVDVDVSAINDSADIKTDGETSVILSDKHIEKTERTLNRRIQTLLSGIIPPPSVTFIQHDITQLLSTYKRNITLMDVPSHTQSQTPIVCSDKERTEDTCDDATANNKQSIMPTELEHIEWPQIKRTNAYGVHYNRSKYTDNIETMYMKLVERNVGQETASSFTFNAANNTSAAAAKKKPIRKLMSSPGNRLSHLARRRAIFSSAHLQSQSQPQLSGLSKLGQKTCIIDASKLSRKEKVATPKRRSLAHRRTPGRKTPSSLKKSSNKQVITAAPKFGTATRETSKRALFLSPTQEEPTHNVAGPANSSSADATLRRIEKSKRALFSPPRRLERSISNLSNSSSQHSSTSFGGTTKMTTIDRLTYFNRTNSDVSINFKRRLEPDDDNENMEPSQQPIKFQRTDQSNYSMHTNKLTKAASENSMYPNQQLSASHKQKLLWAVSTALKKKSISSTSTNFNMYASILGKVVKRLYLESLSTKTESTSGTMLRLADRLVFWVLKGKSVDEIYFEEKTRMGASTKNATKRPSGYINRDQYLMRLEASNKLNTSTQSLGSAGIGNNNSYSNSNENLNCSLNDQNRPILTNSSSKSNVGTNALRENHDSKSAQKSTQHLVSTVPNVSFSGRNQKNLSPYNDKTRSITNLNRSNKLLAGGGANSSILKVKRQISFDN